MRLLCSQPPGRLAPASVIKCSRQESNLVFDLRKVACESGTLREHVTKHTTAVGLHPRYRSATSLTPRRGIEPRPTASKTVMHPPHPQGNLFSTTAARAVLLPARSAAGPCFRPDGFHQAAVAGIEPACVSLTGSCLTVGPHRNVVESARSDLNRRSRAPEARAL